MELRSVLALPIKSYMTLRSLGLLRESRGPVLEDLKLLFQEDAENVVGGIYPIEVLQSGSLKKQLKRIPKLLLESRKKTSKNPQLASPAHREQANLLFLNAADSMRRLLIQPIKSRLNTKDGEGLKILELGCGTGESTRFLKLALPKAKITVIDMSPAQLKRAQKYLKDFERIDFVEAPAEKLPFLSGEFDVVCSSFLFQQLNSGIQAEVIRESARVLRPSGWSIHVDTIQAGDNSDLDELLSQLSTRLNEPLANTMEKCGLKVFDQKRGFLSKAIAGQKTT